MFHDLRAIPNVKPGEILFPYSLTSFIRIRYYRPSISHWTFRQASRLCFVIFCICKALVCGIRHIGGRPSSKSLFAYFLHLNFALSMSFRPFLSHQKHSPKLGPCLVAGVCCPSFAGVGPAGPGFDPKLQIANESIMFDSLTWVLVHDLPDPRCE